MKTASILASLAAGLLLGANAGATVLFQDSFQGNLSQWQKDSGQFHGQIVTAPDGGKALTLNAFATGHDMQTTQHFKSTTGSFTLSFDFMTTTGHTSLSGAFFYADGATSKNASGWILSDTPFNGIQQFADSGTWEHVSYTFAGSSTNLMIEDWGDPQSRYHAVDSLYFRNLTLTDNAAGVKVGTLSVGATVPEPGSVALLGLGLSGLLGLRRKSRRA